MAKLTIPDTVALYDGDPQNADLARIYGLKDKNGALQPDQDEVAGCSMANFRGAERGRFTESLVRHPEVKVRLWDLPGGALPDMARITAAREGREEDAIGHLINSFDRRKSRLTLVHMLHPKPGTTASVRVHLKLFGCRVDHVCIVNEAWGDDYPFWDGHETEDGERVGFRTRDMLLNEFKGVEIQFPALPFGTAARIDAKDLPASKAALDPRFMPQVQDHCWEFAQSFAASVKPALPYLLPPADGWSRTIATTSGKGGIGKSAWLVALADFFRNRAGR